mmetsp:Transcript_7731/g.20042  ORF Transcript_7731/g.20042 Transcript_7731/m.20042 type:complete len:318 (+) Transcript_7731:770-1723(+)
MPAQLIATALTQLATSRVIPVRLRLRKRYHLSCSPNQKRSGTIRSRLAALLISIMPVFDTSIGLIAISLRCTSRSSTAAIMLSNLLRTHTRTVRAALTEAQPIVPGGEVHAFRAVHPDRGLLWAVADGHGRTLGRFRDADRRGGRICRACSAAHVAQPGRGEGYVGAHVQNDARDYVEQRNHSEAAHLCHLAEEALDHHRDERRNVSHDDDRAHRGVVECEHGRGEHQREEEWHSGSPPKHVTERAEVKRARRGAEEEHSERHLDHHDCERQSDSAQRHLVDDHHARGACHEEQAREHQRRRVARHGTMRSRGESRS